MNAITAQEVDGRFSRSRLTSDGAHRSTTRFLQQCYLIRAQVRPNTSAVHRSLRMAVGQETMNNSAAAPALEPSSTMRGTSRKRGFGVNAESAWDMNVSIV